MPSNLPKRWAAVFFIIMVWLVALVVVGILLARAFDAETVHLIGA